MSYVPQNAFDSHPQLFMEQALANYLLCTNHCAKKQNYKDK